MKCFTSYERHNPNTVNGETIVVTQVYSSFDKKEIDVLENDLRLSIGDGVKMEFKYVAKEESAEMSGGGEDDDNINH